MTVDGYNYYICNCGEVVDEDNFIEYGLMCGVCYNNMFTETEQYNLPLDYDILPLDDKK